MEMMVVMLVVAIVMALSAPMITKKTSGAGAGSCLWTSLTGGNIGFNANQDAVSVVIGGNNSEVTAIGANTPKLTIATKGNYPQIGFLQDDIASGIMHITNSINIENNTTLSASPNSVIIGNKDTASASDFSVVIGNQANITSSAQSVAIGNSANVISSRQGVAIGNSANVSSSAYGIAIGNRASTASGLSSVAIGNMANTSSAEVGIAIGDFANAYSGIHSITVGDWSNATLSTKSISMGCFANVRQGVNSIAIGTCANANAVNSIAIGYSTHADHKDSTTIGYGATTSANNQIVLGYSGSTVYIPGNLVVGKITFLGSDAPSSLLEQNMSALYLNFRWEKNYMTRVFEKSGKDDNTLFHDNADNWKNSYYSDRRMKDIIGENLDAMDKINRIKVYDFTFKKDDLKTPHVGVIAQELQKVFPNAVTKDENGYLQIRHEDMVFTMINALKELDAKIKQIALQLADNIKTVASDSEKIRDLTIRVNSQDKEIKALKKEVAELRKIVNKLAH